MALRFASKNINLPATGRTFPHSLPATPDEFTLVQHGPSNVWMSSTTPDRTNVYVTCSNNTGGATASVFAAVNHSYVK